MKTKEEIDKLLTDTDNEIYFLTIRLTRAITDQDFSNLGDALSRIKNCVRDKELLLWVLEEKEFPPDI